LAIAAAPPPRRPRSQFFHVLLDERLNELERAAAAGAMGVEAPPPVPPAGAVAEGGDGAPAHGAPQPPQPSCWARCRSRLQTARLLSLMWSMLCMDVLLVALFTYSLYTHGQSVLMLFAFEFVLLALEVVRVALRYVIVAIGATMQGEWHDRGLYTLYCKLGVDVAKLSVYVAYFLLLFSHYGMPLVMVRDLMRAFAQVNTELTSVIASRRLRGAIDAMATPTPEDLQARDPTCSICLVVRGVVVRGGGGGILGGWGITADAARSLWLSPQCARRPRRFPSAGRRPLLLLTHRMALRILCSQSMAVAAVRT
jgi:hypothetical protein